MPSWPMEMASDTVIVPNSIATPPASRIADPHVFGERPQRHVARRDLVPGVRDPDLRFGPVIVGQPDRPQHRPGRRLRHAVGDLARPRLDVNGTIDAHAGEPTSAAGPVTGAPASSHGIGRASPGSHPAPVLVLPPPPSLEPCSTPCCLAPSRDSRWRLRRRPPSGPLARRLVRPPSGTAPPTSPPRQFPGPSAHPTAPTPPTGGELRARRSPPPADDSDGGGGGRARPGRRRRRRARVATWPARPPATTSAASPASTAPSADPVDARRPGVDGPDRCRVGGREDAAIDGGHHVDGHPAAGAVPGAG